MPINKIALVQFFATAEEASRLADKLASDDPDWRYDINRVTPDRFVIKVYDENNIFLGYL